MTVIERHALPGGLNTYGVAEYKLRPPDSLREVAMIAELGVEFRFGVSIDTEGDLAALEQRIRRDFPWESGWDPCTSCASRGRMQRGMSSTRWSSSRDTRQPAISK